MSEDGVEAAVGARIRKARECAGFSKGTDFADKIGVRAHTLWRYEDGRITPRATVLLKIARACGTTIEWILTGDGAAPEPVRAAG